MNSKDKIIEEYKAFLDNGKTERECVAEAVKILKENGYSDLKKAVEAQKKVEKSGKYYYSYME